MKSLGAADIAMVAAYLLVVLGAGLLMTRRASRSLEDYFLGGRRLPWWLLGIAGMTTWFDLAGTMIITSFLFLLGPQGLYIEFRGGAVLVLAFLIAYTGKWHRRSGCRTSAEWVNYRFGNDAAAGWMRMFIAAMAFLTTIGLLAYLIRGLSLFVGMFVPYPPLLVTLILVGFCGIYTMFSGFYGVVLTDLVQGVFMLAACVVVSVIAFHAVPDAGAVSALALKVTGNPDWAATFPRWNTTLPRGYEMYQSLFVFAGFYLLRTVLAGMGSGGESRYFGARSDRDCGLQSMLLGITITLRWPMMIGFAVLGMVLVEHHFPDQAVIEQAAEAMRRHHPGITAATWHDVTSQLASLADEPSSHVEAELASILGAEWREKLPLVSARGTVNPEQILPAVILHSLPHGVRGLLIVAMLAAMMSTLAGVVNQTSALMVCDIYQNRLRPGAANRELILASYAATWIQLAGGFWMGVQAGSLNELWGWIIMGLGAGGLAPYLLRLYWWRCNSWGIAGGIGLGAAGAVTQRIVMPEMIEWQQFLLMSALSFIGTIAGSLMTAPTAMGTLRHFYRTTRPFGWWRPLWNELPETVRAEWGREHRNDILAVPFLMLTQVTAFLMAMHLVIHAHRSLLLTLPFLLIGLAGVYRFWWKPLPPAISPESEPAPGKTSAVSTVVTAKGAL